MPRTTGVKHDYKPRTPHRISAISRWGHGLTRGIPLPARRRRRLLGIALLLSAMVPALFGGWPGAQSQTQAAAGALERQMALPLPEPELATGLVNRNPVAEREYRERSLRVRPGESLSQLFRREGLSRMDLHFITALGEEAASLARIRPGEELVIHDDGTGNVLYLARELDEERMLHVHRTEEGFTKEISELPIQRRVRHAEGEIQRSLYQDALAEGLSDGLIMELAFIFQWDVDFVLDIRRGDEFRVVYEALYKDGEPIGHGRILAAEIVNRGESIRALYYENPQGEADYYAPGGDSMRRTFLRAPLEYIRISSHFNPNRQHPKLNRMRAHTGVDYAAPEGTPVRAAGDGRITYRGRRGGYGNTVQIRHGGRYETLYAHLSRFASGVGVGSRVEQGEVIAYVGETGLATGPHLHYEFLVDGVHKDPVQVEIPAADPVPEEFREHFRRTTSPLVAELDLLNGPTRLIAQEP